ncbi:U-scoloptoxin(05)-Sm1a isoform X2 [Diorhabda carinulata]|uniref:U-scoloptoxin(05)-Sm1a isoform X2 n=1 Tax=Diorhabda carinulata TaxID=1163345 RepID=UPI0025A29355|nr:U-scoloptoxin(05)-Sm1a isoform X2 [Diorhabda carinulata]
MCSSQFLLPFIIFNIFINISYALNCYQCSGNDSNKPFQCNEWLSSDIDINPEPCDSIFGAKYCIKHVGRFEAFCIKCYQCSSSKTIDCSDGMIHMGGLKPQSCDDVFEAKYCIKSTSLDGGIGAKRFCSSLDLGNYCNYVKQPGDSLTYRTCVYTCTGEGCNPANTKKPYSSLLLSVTTLLMLRFR